VVVLISQVVQGTTVGGHNTPSQWQTVANSDRDLENSCVICHANDKEWGFKHGETVHLCACEVCAHTWFLERPICPMCNVPAEEILHVFSA
jgi:hypothetical protein